MVAECRPIPAATLEDVAATSQPAAVMVLDRLVVHNVGAVVRSAVAAGITGFVLSDRRAAPLSRAAFRRQPAPWSTPRWPSSAPSPRRWRRFPVWVCGRWGSTPPQERSLWGLELLTEPVAIVVGGEGGGLSRLVADRVDVTVSIPMFGPTESLNASVASALAAFEVARIRSVGRNGPWHAAFRTTEGTAGTLRGRRPG